MDTNITRVHGEDYDYAVGKDGVMSIEPSNQGSKHLEKFKISYADDNVLFLGVYQPNIEYERSDSHGKDT